MTDADTAWTWRDDEELAEMFEEYPRIEPVIERIVQQDAALEELRRDVDSLKQRLEQGSKRTNA